MEELRQREEMHPRYQDHGGHDPGGAAARSEMAMPITDRCTMFTATKALHTCLPTELSLAPEKSRRERKIVTAHTLIPGWRPRWRGVSAAA
jgi:hypothetical protein